MRIALISDIHANFEALKCLSDRLMEADQIICLGDFVGYYCQVNEVLDFMRGLNGLCILGNHDDFLLNGCPDSAPEAIRFGVEYADRVIAAEHRRWLSTLPLVWGGVLDRCSFLLCHGSPWRPLADYLYPDNPALEELQSFDYDIVAFGQTHRPMIRSAQRPWLVNPGSVGQSRHACSRACGVLFDTQKRDLTVIEQPYDPGIVIQQARQHGAGNWILKHLLSE